MRSKYRGRWTKEETKGRDRKRQRAETEKQKREPTERDEEEGERERERRGERTLISCLKKVLIEASGMW